MRYGSRIQATGSLNKVLVIALCVCVYVLCVCVVNSAERIQ